MTTNETDEFLEHHGIKGQHWGERRGKNYPLSANQHSSEQAKAGTKGWTQKAKHEAPKIKKFATAFKAKSDKHKANQEAKKAAKEQQKETKKSEDLKEKTRKLQEETAYLKAIKDNKAAKAALRETKEQGKSELRKAFDRAAVGMIEKTLTKTGEKLVDKMFEGKKSEIDKAIDKTKKLAELAKAKSDLSSNKLSDKKNQIDLDDYTRNEKTINETNDLNRKKAREDAVANARKSSDANTVENIQFERYAKTAKTMADTMSNINKAYQQYTQYTKSSSKSESSQNSKQTKSENKTSKNEPGTSLAVTAFKNKQKTGQDASNKYALVPVHVTYEPYRG